jgi:ubiquinone/menaquinone biosynthesis C-methylase UbiE
MDKILTFIRREWLIFAGIAAGAIGGYLYWYFIGCESGSCPITSSPLNSSIYGALLGALLLSTFKKSKKKDNFKNKAVDWDSPMKVEMAKKFVSEMLKNVNLGNDKKVLDYGCGTGLVGMEVAPLVKSVVFIDNSAAMVNVLENKLGKAFEKHVYSSENIKVIMGDINKYITKDIDVVFSLMALHHVEDVQAAFEHISANILKPGGLLVIGDLKEENGSFHGEEKVPHNGFDIPNFAQQLEFSDMEVITTNTYNTIQKNGNEYEQFIIIAKKQQTN